jgi:hypothetical protein
MSLRFRVNGCTKYRAPAGKGGVDAGGHTGVRTYADERARPVLVLHHDGPLAAQERDPFNFMKIAIFLSFRHFILF